MRRSITHGVSWGPAPGTSICPTLARASSKSRNPCSTSPRASATSARATISDIREPNWPSSGSSPSSSRIRSQVSTSPSSRGAIAVAIRNDRASSLACSRLIIGQATAA